MSVFFFFFFFKVYDSPFLGIVDFLIGLSSEYKL